MEELTAKSQRSRRDAKEEGVSEDGFSEGRKPAEGGLESKERRSSVGFFDFVKFRAFRGFSIFSRKKAKNRRKRGIPIHLHFFAFSCAFLRLNPIVIV
jgi:hypothetical protein